MVIFFREVFKKSKILKTAVSDIWTVVVVCLFFSLLRLVWGILGYGIFTHFYFGIWDSDPIYFGIWDIQEIWDMGYWNLFWETN